MAYATQQDMLDRFDEAEIIQLTDEKDLGVVDTAILAKALADADAAVDGYLMGRYTLPLATVPVALTRIACDLARFFLYDDVATEGVRKRYEDALDFLKALASGKISLGLDNAQQRQPEAGGPKAAADERVFTKGTLGDYQ